MSPSGIVTLTAIGIVALASAAIGFLGVRFTRSTSDFLVASRTVKPLTNASAISGEYLSAASFLGIAGLIIAVGADALWYPVAFVVGYLALQLFVAAPLRRSGAYTVPDFAEARLGSPVLRRLSTAVVLLICWLYMLPQLQGAGFALTALTALPSWTGVATTGVVVLLTVVSGGMRSITFVQAFQFWIKVAAIAVPVAALLGLLLSTSAQERAAGPDFDDVTTVTVHTGVVLDVPGAGDRRRSRCRRRRAGDRTGRLGAGSPHGGGRHEADVPGRGAGARAGGRGADGTGVADPVADG